MTESDPNDEDTATKTPPKKRRRDHKKKSKRRKRRRTESSDDCSSVSRRASRKERRKKKKKKRESKRYQREDSDDDLITRKEKKMSEIEAGALDVKNGPAGVPQQSDRNPEEESLEARRRAMIPMTKEQYEANNARITEVFDAESGRYRLVRGNGEIIERIVSRQEHQQINRRATQSDGSSFARHVHQRARY